MLLLNVTPCYSYVFAMYPYVSVCNLYVSVWCFSRDRSQESFRLILIVRVNVVLNRTVVFVDSD